MGVSDPWRLECGQDGVLAPGRWLLARAMLWLLALFAFAAFLLFASFQLRGWLGLPKSFGYAVGIGVPAAGLAVYALLVRIGERRNASELDLRRAPLDLAAGALIGFAFMAITVALEWALGLATVARGRWQDGFHYLVFNAYISAMVEELGFRAIMLRLLARMFGPIPGLLISAALFALAHAGHASPIAVALLVINGGLLLGVLYMMSGSLWLAIGAHIAYDFTEWSLFGVGDSDGLLAVRPSPAHAAWLTGGTFGPDASVVSAFVAIGLIAAVLAIGRVRKAGFLAA